MEDESEPVATRSAQSAELDAIALRIAVILRTAPSDKCVRETGKSLKQLRRYAAGSEPPAGVIFGLAAAAGCSASWLFLGVPHLPQDYVFEEEMLLAQLASVRLKMETEAKTVADLEVLKELEGWTLKMISINGEMSKLNQQIATNRQTQGGRVPSVKPTGARVGMLSSSQGAPISVASGGKVDKDHVLLRAVVEVVEETLQGRHVNLAPSKKADLISLAYAVMLDERDQQQGSEKVVRLAKLAG